jgi:hypothetical protein
VVNSWHGVWKIIFCSESAQNKWELWLERSLKLFPHFLVDCAESRGDIYIDNTIFVIPDINDNLKRAAKAAPLDV